MKIVLVQLPVPNDRLVNLPLALGYLKAAAESPAFVAAVRGETARAEDFSHHTRPFPDLTIDLLAPAAQNRGGDAHIVAAILAHNPDMVGFSLYTWNSSRSLGIARALKAAAPKLLILGGGPEVDPAASFVLAEPAFDFLIHGEGEATFVQLVDHFERGVRWGAPELADIAGLGRRDFTTETQRHREGRKDLDEEEIGWYGWRWAAPRYALPDVNAVPSAYLSGALDVHFGDGGLRGFIALELSRWCPSKCTFCYYGRQNIQRGGKRYFELDRLRAELDFARTAGATRLHLIEANFNTLPHLDALFDLIETTGAHRRMGFYAELRGEAVDVALADRLAALNFGPLEVGLQATDPAVLARVRRKNNLPRLAAGVHNLRQRGIDVFLDVILGLPGETATTFQASLDWLAANDLAPYDMFPLQILAGTQLKTEVDAGLAYPDAAGRGHGIVYQDAPPYFVHRTADLDHATLCRLRADFIIGQGGDPAHIDGLPQSDSLALVTGIAGGTDGSEWLTVSPAVPVERLVIERGAMIGADAGAAEVAGRILAARLGCQITVYADLCGGADEPQLATLAGLLAGLSAPNLSGVWHIFVETDAPLPPDVLARLGGAVCHAEGYLDRLGILALGRAETGLPLSVQVWNIAPVAALQRAFRASRPGYIARVADVADSAGYARLVAADGGGPAAARAAGAALANESGPLWFASALAERAYREAQTTTAIEMPDPLDAHGVGPVTLIVTADMLHSGNAGHARRLSRAALDAAELRVLLAGRRGG